MAGNSVGTAYLTLVPKLDKDFAKQTEGQLKGTGESGGKEFSDGFNGGFAGGIKKLAKIGAVVEAGKLVGQTFLDSFNASARYEQLIGGVETLFKDSSGELMKYAKEAYKTAGISANDYMEQATSFSASLIQSLGGDTAKAASYANMAMVDMSDNANKMGTDIGRISDAYQGFSRQNFTMLDNLKLGYGGTKQEMERLLEDAERIKAANGEMVDYSIDSFSDMVEAIHVVQENMGITGTTATEASSTVEGSINQMKAAWDNMLVAMGTGENIQETAQQLVDSFITAMSNIIPLAGQVMLGLLNAILNALGDLIAQGVIVLAQGTLQFIQAISDGCIGMINTVVGAIGGFVGAVDSFISGGINAIAAAAGGFVSNIRNMISNGVSAVGSFVGQFASAARNLIQGMVAGLDPGAVLAKIRSICASAVDAIKSFFGIHSPSRVMRELFGYVGDGMVLGLEDSEKDVDKAMGRLMDSTYAVADGFTSSIGLGSGIGGSYNFSGITINATDRTMDEVFDELVAYANRSRVMMGVR